MSREITFSIKYPSLHPRKGEPTHFVEQIWNSSNIGAFGEMFYWPGEEDLMRLNKNLPHHILDEFKKSLLNDRSKIGSKSHTIRQGNRWKVGDIFTPRVWSGRPYNTPKITIADDMEVKKTWDFEIKQHRDGILTQYLIHINSRSINWGDAERIIKNDGLNYTDFCNWFGLNRRVRKPIHFIGQIICWNDKIEY